MTPSDLSGMNAFQDSMAAARLLAAAALPDAPLAMPEQRLETARPYVTLRELFAAPWRRAEP